MSEKRRVLEVLKWASPEDILTSLSLVSQLWLSAANEDELWISLSQDCDYTPFRPPGGTFKSGFYAQSNTYLPVITKKRLLVYDCSAKRCVSEVQLTESLLEDYNAAAVLIQPGGAVVCGGTNSNLACYIDPSGSVANISPMHYHRSFHSIAFVHGTVYVFGGTTDCSSQVAEMLTISSFSEIANVNWSDLPNSLASHSACCPCVNLSTIYLCGGNTDICEKFDTATKEYSLLPVRLPESMFGAATFLRNGELIIATQKFVSYWRPGTDLRTTRNQMECPGVWTMMRQRLVGGCIYSSERGELRVFELENGVRSNLRID